LHTPDLHSFPTRRSSDLGTSPACQECIQTRTMALLTSSLALQTIKAVDLSFARRMPPVPPNRMVRIAGSHLARGNDKHPFQYWLDRKSTRLISSHLVISY